MKRHFTNDYIYTAAQSGATVSTDEIITPDILSQIIYMESEKLMLGREAVNIKPVSRLEYRFQMPKQDLVEVQDIQEGARADYNTLTWFDFGGTLYKKQQSLDFTDEVFVRQLDTLQYDVSVQACAQGFAVARDKNIFDKLVAKAGATQAAADVWSDSVSGDPIGDIASCIGTLLDETTVMPSEISKIKLFYPMKLYEYLKVPIQIGEMYDTINDYVGKKFNINPLPTRYFSTQAMAVLTGDRTAFHLNYAGNEIPTAESERVMGVGQRYIFTQYYDTVVMPDDEDTLTSSKIRLITGVSV